MLNNDLKEKKGVCIGDSFHVFKTRCAPVDLVAYLEVVPRRPSIPCMVLIFNEEFWAHFDHHQVVVRVGVSLTRKSPEVNNVVEVPSIN